MNTGSDTDGQRKVVDEAVDTKVEAVGDREVSPQHSLQKRGLQSEDSRIEPLIGAGRKKSRRKAAPLDSSDISASELGDDGASHDERGEDDGEKGQEIATRGQHRSTDGEDRSDATNAKGDTDRANEGKDNTDEEKEPSDDAEATFLYPDNIMAAAAATNDELASSGMSALGAASPGSHLLGSEAGSQHSQTRRRSSADSSRLSSDIAPLGLLQKVMLENIQLRRANEQLLLELQASKNVISRLLADRDPSLIGSLLRDSTEGHLYAGMGSNLLASGSIMSNNSGLLGALQSQAGQQAIGQITTQAGTNPGLQISQLQQGGLSMDQLRALAVQEEIAQRHFAAQGAPQHVIAATQRQLLQQRLPAFSHNPQLQQALSLGLGEQLRLEQSQAHLNSSAASSTSESRKSGKSKSKRAERK